MMFWVSTPCRLVARYRRFEETYFLHFNIFFFRNVAALSFSSSLSSIYTVLLSTILPTPELLSRSVTPQLYSSKLSFHLFWVDHYFFAPLVGIKD
jgi:hypothetical protein